MYHLMEMLRVLKLMKKALAASSQMWFNATELGMQVTVGNDLVRRGLAETRIHKKRKEYRLM